MHFARTLRPHRADGAHHAILGGLTAINTQRPPPWDARSMRSSLIIVALATSALCACDAVPWLQPRAAGGSFIELSGTVDAHEVDLSFQVPGRIAALDTDEGRAVVTGQVVARLDARDYELALARARAQASSADKALAVLKAGSRAQDIRAADAGLRQARADLALARTQQERTAKLVAENFSPPQQLDTANDQLAVATAKVEQAEQNLSLLREGARKEDIERASADLAAANVASDIAAQQLAYTRLASPVSGVVSARLAEQGQNVTAGQAVFRVAQLDRPWVRVYLSEKDLPRVALGQPAQVRVDGVPNVVFTGRLSFVSPEAEFTPKTVETKALRVDLVYRATVDVVDAGERLKIGMPADVRFALEP